MRLASRVAGARIRPGRLRRARTQAGPTPTAITFPTSDLQCRVWIALTPDYSKPWWQWGWASITEYVRWDPGITVTDGRRDDSATVSTLDGSMVLENDGRFSRRNAFSPYYPFLTRNTPIWAQVNPGDGWHDRLHGYVNSWPKRWDITGTDSVVPVSIGGVKRRLDSDDTEKSAMARTCAGPDEDGIEPIAYWSMEDGENATQFASALPGGTPAILGGVSDLAVSDVIEGSQPLPIWPAGAVSQAQVPAHTDIGRWSVQIASHMPTNAEVTTSGVVRAFHDAGSIIVGPTSIGTQITTIIRDTAGTITGGSNESIDASLVLDQNLSYVITAVDNASGTDDYFYVRVFNGDGTAVLSVDYNMGPGAYGKITSAYPGGLSHNYTGMTLGHLQVVVDANWDEDTSGVPAARAMSGWNGESTDERIARVCREESIPFATYAGAETSALGPQPSGRTSAVLADAEKADRGVLFEHEFGLAYQSPRDRYNQPVHLALDQAEGHLAESVEADDDDQDYINQWTASRTDGSSSTFRDPNYRELDGLFAGGDTYNVETDGQLPHIAGWEVHKGTVDEDRWPMLAINLANHPELIPDWVAMPFGGRIQVDNPYAQVGVDLIDAIREGRSEHWNSKQWTARMNTTPASVHTIAVYDDGVSRYGANDSSLSAAVDADDTSWTVDPGTDTWATSASHPDVFPFDIDTGGLTYSCTAITGAVTDTFTRTEVDGWGSATTGQAWTLSGGTNPGNYDVNGTQGTHTLDSVNVRRHSLLDTSATDFDVFVDVTLPVVPTGAAITLWLAGRVTDTSNYYAAYLSVATSGAVTLVIGERVGGTSADLLSASAGTHSASDVWRIRFQGVGRRLAAKAWNVTGGASEPDGWLVETWDDSLTSGTSVGLLSRLESGNTNGTVTVSWDSLHTVLAPLTFTVVRLATDKAHAAGTAVTVTDTGVYGI